MNECCVAGLMPRLPSCGIGAAFSKSDAVHGIDAELRQPPDRPPLVAGAEDRQPQAEQVADDLTPADAAMDFDEVTAAGHFGAQGATRFQFAENLAAQFFHSDEWIVARPQRAERFAENQRRFAHTPAPRIRSAARSALL